MSTTEARVALADELTKMSSAISACIHSQELFSEFVDEQLPSRKADLIEISTLLKDVLKVNKQPTSSNLFAAFGENIESTECRLFKEAVLGSRGSMMNRMAGEVQLGLVHNDSSLMIQFLQAFPPIEKYFQDYLMDKSKPYNEALKEASRLWSISHPVDDEFPPHACELSPPPPAPDEERVQRIHRLNLSLHYAKEDWESLLSLRDEIVTTFNDYLEQQAAGEDGVAARLQQLVWMSISCITLFNPRLTPIQIFETIGSRLRICSEQTQVFVSEIESEQLKRSSNSPGLWSRFVSALYRNKKNNSQKKNESDHAFDKLSAAYLDQAQLLLHHCIRFNGLLEAAKPGIHSSDQQEIREPPKQISTVSSSPPLNVEPAAKQTQVGTPVPALLPSPVAVPGLHDSLSKIPVAR